MSQQLARHERPLLARRIDWSHGAGFALTHDPFLLHFMHRWWAWVVVAVLVVFARQRSQGRRRARRVDRDPFRVRHADPARHPDGHVGNRAVARGPPPGDRRAAARRNRVGRARARAARSMSVVSVYAVFADARGSRAHRPRSRSRSGSPPASTSSPVSARSTAGRARSRRRTRSPPSSRRSTAQRRRADRAHRRAPQLRGSVHRHLADRQVLASYADWVEGSVG